MAADIANCTRVAAMLEDSRTSARRLFGEDYDARVAAWRQAVRACTRIYACRPIEVPTRLESDGKFPTNPMLLFAAVADVIEEGQPSS